MPFQRPWKESKRSIVTAFFYGDQDATIPREVSYRDSFLSQPAAFDGITISVQITAADLDRRGKWHSVHFEFFFNLALKANNLRIRNSKPVFFAALRRINMARNDLEATIPFKFAFWFSSCMTLFSKSMILPRPYRSKLIF